jgi:hypothetical protein
MQVTPVIMSYLSPRGFIPCLPLGMKDSLRRTFAACFEAFHFGTFALEAFGFSAFGFLMWEALEGKKIAEGKRITKGKKIAKGELLKRG